MIHFSCLQTFLKKKLSARGWKQKLIFALFLCFVILNCFFKMNMAKAKKDVLIVVDPGHGGNDPGKVSADGVLEKDINLEIAKRLKAELQARGIKVVLTRTEDCNLSQEGARNKKSSDLRKRLELVRECQGDYLVSIHQNSYPDTSVSGPQVFYYSPLEESKALAQMIQASIVANVNPNKVRVIKPGDDYYILKKSNCPAVIVECGFLSSAQEIEALQNPEYQQQMARSIAKGICQYLEK